MMNPIGSNGYGYGYYNRNTFHNFHQNPVSAVESLKKVNNQTTNLPSITSRKLDKEMTSFLNDYRNQLNDLKKASNGLRNYASGNVWDQGEAVAVDQNILSVKTNYASQTAKDMAVDVRQLAQSQVNHSQSVAASATGAFASGQVVLSSQGKDYHFNLDASGGTNKEILMDLAKQMNGSLADVKASVTEKDGQVQLQLEGKHTGSNQTFSLRSDTGIAFEQSQDAKDAIYAVNGDVKRSSTNQVALDSYRVSAELKQTGSSKVQFGANAESVQSAVENLVSEYNDTIKLLNDNGERGTGVLQQLRNMLMPPISEKSMKSIGLSYQKDGTLSFQADKFQKAYKEDSKQLRELLGGTYSIAGGLSRKSDQAMAQPSYTLVNADQVKLDDLKQQQKLQLLNSLGSMPSGTYSRNGNYGYLNSGAMGMFLNVRV